jgi:hypothetical protein
MWCSKWNMWNTRNELLPPTQRLGNSFLDQMTTMPLIAHTDQQLQKVEAAIDTMSVPILRPMAVTCNWWTSPRTMVARVRLHWFVSQLSDECEMTIKGGVEEAIKRVAPQISGVEAYEEI